MESLQSSCGRDSLTPKAEVPATEIRSADFRLAD
jgi:hypothetical protein